MSNTYRIRQCPRTLITSDEQPPVEVCRMFRQEFGFDRAKRGFFWFFEPRIQQVILTEEQLHPYLAQLIHGVVPEQPQQAAA
jgi:hypothetical protein